MPHSGARSLTRSGNKQAHFVRTPPVARQQAAYSMDARLGFGNSLVNDSTFLFARVTVIWTLTRFHHVLYHRRALYRTGAFA